MKILRKYLWTSCWIISGITILAACNESPSSAEEHVTRAEEFRANGQVPAAIIELKNAIQKAPNNNYARVMLGRIYVEEGDGAAAEKELKKALESGTGGNFIAVSLAEALLLQQKFSEVHKIQQFLANYPSGEPLSPEERAVLLTLRGHAYAGQGDVENAQVKYREALELSPESPDAAVGMAALAAASGKFGEARELLGRVLTDDPGFARAWSVTGDIERLEGNLEAAEQAYGKAIEARRNNVAERLYRALVRIALQDYKGATGDIQALKKRVPGNVLVKHAEGILNFQQQKYAEARQNFEDVLRRTPDYLPAVFYLGVVQAVQKNWEQADINLARVVQAVPQLDAARMVLGHVRLNLGDPDAAEALLQPLWPRMSGNAAVAKLLGVAAAEQGKMEEAVKYFDKVVEAEPDSGTTRLNLGLSLLLEGNQQRGVKELETAVELDDSFHYADLILVLSYLRSKQFDQAIERAKSWQQRQPDSPVPLNLMGMIYLSQGEMGEARMALDRALQVSPGYPPAAHNLAQLELEQGATDKASELYQSVLRTRPTHLRTLLRLAQLETQQGNPQEARSILEKAMDAHPKAPQPRLILSEQHLRAGDPERALIVLQGARPVDGLTRTVLLLRTGEAQMAVNSFDEAVRTFRELVALIPRSANAHYLLAKAYAGVNDDEQSMRALERALQLQPENVPAKLAKIRSLATRGQLSEADELMANLIAEHPDNTEILAQFGWLSLQQGRVDEGLSAFRKAYARAPSSQLAVRIALAQLQNGDAAAGIATLERRTAEHPDDVVAWQNLANLYHAVGDLGQARGAFEKVLALSPDHIRALNGLAWILRDKEPELARQYAERASELAPDSPEVLDTLGWVLVALGEAPRAARLLERASSLAPENATISYHVAVALAATGDANRARDRLRALLEQDTMFPEREEAVALLQSFDDPTPKTK